MAAEDAAPKPIPLGYDRYDLRAADEPDRSERFRQVLKSSERQRWDDVAVGIQALLEIPTDSLFRGPDQIWRPLWQVAIDHLMSSPQAHSAYIDRYASAVEQALVAAARTNDWDARFRLARSYLVTPAGQAATRAIIDLGIDQGDTDCVALRVADLLRVRSGQLNDAVWRGELKAFLLAQRRLGLVQRLAEFGGDPIPTQTPPIPKSSMAPVITEWTTVQGHPSGYSQARVDEPLLIPRWRHRLAAIPAVGAAYTEIERTLRKDYGEFFRPICGIVASRGVIAARTATGLVALEGSTGRVLWEVDSLIRQPNENGGGFGNAFDEDDEDRGTNLSRLYEEGRDVLQSRLTSLAVFGTLATDGDRVMEVVPWRTVSRDRAGVLWSATGDEEDELVQNAVIARNLRTGRIEWSVGGPESEELPGWPASGTYFFGPPTPDGEELFAIGERRGDIFLYCLQGDTGEVLWKQLLASPEVNVHRDYVRAQWAAVPSVRAGLVICPTTTGWLVAVDRQTQRICWASRLIDRVVDADNSPFGGTDGNRDYGINRRHAPSQPIIVGHRVLLSPMEFPDEQDGESAGVMGFDLETGERLWEQSHDRPESAPGVVGVTETLAVSGHSHLHAFSLDDGTRGDNLLLAESIMDGKTPEVRINTKPLVTTNGLLIATDQGEMLSLPLLDDQIPSLIFTPAEPNRTAALARIIDPLDRTAPRLGQFATLDGMLISVSPWEVVVWEKRADIAKWKELAPTDPRAALRQAQSLAVKGDLTEARAVLARAAELPGGEELRHQIHEVRTAVLLESVQRQLDSEPSVRPDDALWEELRAVCSSDADRETFQALAIERELQSKNWDAAWLLVRDTIRTPWKQTIQRRGRTLASEVWLGQVVLKLAQAPLPHRTALRELLLAESREQWTQAKDQAERDRLTRILGDLPDADAQELSALLDPLHTSSKVARLEALSRSGDRDVARRASLALIEQLATPDWTFEAQRRIARLQSETDWPADQKSRLEALARTVSALPLPSRAASWAEQKVEVLRKRESSDQILPESSIRWGSHRFETQNWSYSYESQQAAIVIQREDGSVYAEFPLATNELNAEDESPPVLFIEGYTCYAQHMSILHAFSLPEKRELWRRQVTGPVDSSDEDDAARTLWPLERFSKRGYTPEVTLIRGFGDRQLIVTTSEGIEVLDAFTGDLLWSHSSPLPGSIYGTGEWLLWRHDSTAECWSLRDGRVLVAPDLVSAGGDTSEDEFGLNPLSVSRSSQPGMVTLEQLALATVPLAEAPQSIDRWDQSDLLALKSVWSVTRPDSTLIGGELKGAKLLIDPEGLVQQLDLQTGKTAPLGSIPKAFLTSPEEGPSIEYHSMLDHDRVYLYRQPAHGSPEDYEFSESISVNSMVYAVPLRPGVAGWSAELNGTIAGSRLHAAPFLTELHQEAVKIGELDFERMHISLIDKSTGKPAHQFHLPRIASSVYGVSYDPALKRVSIVADSELIRLEVQTPPPPAAPTP